MYQRHRNGIYKPSIALVILGIPVSVRRCHSPRHSRKATWQETVSQEECIYTAVSTAIALQSIHLFQSHCINFSPAHTCLYIYSHVLTPGLYQIDMGIFLALWQWA